MSTVIDLSSLGPRGFVIEGDADSDRAGFSVSGAGDVDGDGFDDIIVSAPFAEPGASGLAYVIYGKASAFSTIDLGSLATSVGATIGGAQGSDFLGFSVSAAGDINGDGFDDVILASGGGPYYGSSSDRYVIFGHASGIGAIDVNNLTASQGFALHSEGGFYDTGGPVSSAGDVNGDGFDDILIGDSSDGSAGGAYLVFGKSGNFPATIDLNTLSSPLGVKIESSDASELAGFSVAAAGDLNGDGKDDILISAPFNDAGGADAGKVYVMFGKGGTFTTVALSSLPSAIRGDAPGDLAGWSISSAGDFNNDGLDDLIIGAPGSDAGGTDAGAAYVIFGKASGLGQIDLGNLSASTGFMIRGDSAGDSAGTSVAGAGDVNGDGFDDVIVGAPGGDDGGTDAGEAYVIYGHAGGSGTVDLTGLGPDDGFIIQGDTAGDNAGRSVSGAGDIDGDGFDDIIVGAPFGDNNGPYAGEAYVVFGFGTGSSLIGTDAADSLRGGTGADHIEGRGGNDLLYGLAGDDDLFGGNGNDRMDGGSGSDRLFGGAGNDLYIVRDTTDFVFENPGEGTDTVNAGISYTLRTNVEQLNLTGTAAISGTGNDLANIIKGNLAANTLRGGAGDDRVFGGAGDDAVRGGDGQDWLEGGTGRDRFYGDAGSDTFVFRSGDFAGLTSSTADQIVDFSHAEGDRIRLSLVDANPTVTGDQAFDFLGTAAFTGSAGELRYQQLGGNTYVQGDIDGDGSADFWIRLDGLHTLVKGDFIL